MRAAVVGATGFTGAVLTDLLSGHPAVDAAILTSSSYAGRRMSEVFPHLRVETPLVEYDAAGVGACDVAFVCLPHGKAHPIVAELVDAGTRVIDLSADFRLDAADYPGWYGFEHPRAGLVGEAVYGLPERYRDQIGAARLVANPGCFPTGSLLALLPLAGTIDVEMVVVDAKSGVSGAGKSPTDKTHFCAVNDNFRSYSEVGHRHTREIVTELARAAGGHVPVSFTPHLLPVDRGILSTVYVRPAGELPAGNDLYETYERHYAEDGFVEITAGMPSLREVQYTNYCRMGLRVDEAAGLVKIVSVIDNLVKGASGQAVQNMNLMLGLPEDAGLGGRS